MRSWILAILMGANLWALPMIGSKVSQGLEETHTQECPPWTCYGRLIITQGAISATYELRDHIPTSYMMGLGLEMNYYKQIEMDLRIQYAMPNTTNSVGESVPLHMALMEAGFAYVAPKYWGRYEAGLGMHFTSARSELETTMLIESNESDFGHYVRWSSPRWSIRQWGLGLGVSYWTAWTKPQLTSFIGIELQGVYNLWD